MMTDKKINVLVTGPSTEGGKGGQVTHIENIKGTFKNHNFFQVNFFVSSSAEEGNESVLKKLLLMIYRSCLFPFCLKKIEMVHINSTMDNKAMIRDLPLMLWTVIFGKHLIIQYHGGNFLTTIFYRNYFLKYILISLIKRSKKVLVLTNPQVELMHSFGIKNVLKIVNYVSCPIIDNEKPETFTFIFLGRIIKEKGIFEILDACNQLKENSNFKVLFYGDGPDRHLLLEEIINLELSDVVEWKGMVEGSNKHAAFSGANAFILPSYAEGLPYSVLEAMSYGLPVIATDVGSLSKLVKDEETGLVVEVRDSISLGSAIYRLLNNTTLYGELSDNAIKLIRDNYSNDKMLAVFSNIWTSK